MATLSRIFRRALQISVPSAFIGYSAVGLNRAETENKDEDECETPICHDADEAIKEYSGFLNRNKMASAIRRGSGKAFMAPPPDRQQLGRHSWTLIHTIAAYYPDHPTEEQKQNVLNFFDVLSKVYPCSVCAADLKHELIEHPPEIDNRDQFIQWVCALHNRINKKLHKTTFDCRNHQKRWRKEHNHQKPWHDIQEFEEQGEVELDDDDEYK